MSLPFISNRLFSIHRSFAIPKLMAIRAVSSTTTTYDWNILALGGDKKTAVKAQKFMISLGYKNAKLIGVNNTKESDQEIIAALKEKQWDAISIGGYVNGFDTDFKSDDKDLPKDKGEILLWFNRILNIIHELAPKSKIILVKSPQDMHNGIQRIMGEEQNEV